MRIRPVAMDYCRGLFIWKSKGGKNKEENMAELSELSAKL
jgi:hypothetical protein